MSDDPHELTADEVYELQREMEERKRDRSYTAQDCLQAIREVNERTDLRLSEGTYVELKDDTHPSLGTIRNRCGTFTDARERALDGS